MDERKKEKRMPLTFVTAFMNIYGKIHNNKPSSMRFQHFQQVAASGIPILLFTDKESQDGLELPANANVKIIELSLEDFTIAKLTREVGSLEQPSQRCMKKDTLEFMMLMNAKIECMVKAVELNPFNTSHFAWMDFSLSYIFKQPEETIRYMKELSQKNFAPTLFAIPGCWQKGYLLDSMWDRILWRFCGGFFVADPESIFYLYELYMDSYQSLLQESKRMTWETNVWAWLEEKKGWSPNWFLADHNDSIVRIPEESFI